MINDFSKYFKSENPFHSSELDSFLRRMSQVRGYITPYIFEERKLNVTQLDVFSRLMMDRIIFVGEEVTSETMNILNSQLLYLNNVDTSDITLYINTPGGSVHDGLSAVDTMNFITSDVSTVCLGMAASMGSILLVNGEKGKRYALPHSRVLIHQPLGGTQGQATDMEIAVEQIKILKQELYEIISAKSGQPIEKIYKDADRDHWMTAKEALEYGMIDEIITKENKKG